MVCVPPSSASLGRFLAAGSLQAHSLNDAMAELKWLVHETGEIPIYKITVAEGSLKDKVVSVILFSPPPKALVVVPKAAFGTVWDKRCLSKAQVGKHKSFRLEQGVAPDGEVIMGARLDFVIAELKVDPQGIFEPGLSAEDHDLRFVDGLTTYMLYPTEDVLKTIVADNFAQEGYATAQEEQAEQPGVASGSAQGVEGRMAQLETDMIGMNATLKRMESLLVGSPTPKSGAKSAAKPSIATQNLEAAALPEDVQAEALATGVSKAQLDQLLPLLKSNVKGLATEQRLPAKKVRVNALDEEDDSAQSEPDGDQASGDRTMAQCLIKLTELTSGLVQPTAKKSKLEDLLSGSTHSQSALAADALSPVLSSRNGAQGYLGLRRIIDSEEDSKYLINMIEGNMQVANAGSGTVATQSVESRPDPLFYLEHRSRVTAYESNVNWLWSLGHAIKAFQANKPNEGLARLLLMMVAGEQVALDGGHWLMAYEYTLLDEPPMASFAAHGPSSVRLPHSRLVDPRLHDILWSRIKSIDDAVERKKKILGTQRFKPPYQTLHGQPKGDQKGDRKGDQKGKGKGETQQAPEGGNW